MMSSTYTEPITKLLSYGDCRNFLEWPDYLGLGFKQDHVPDLISMATDEELICADSDSLEVWAPIHAWRALGQLHAAEAIEPLMELFDELDDGDWIGEELPTVYQLIGPPAVPALSGYLTEDSNGIFARIIASDCLQRIGNAYAESREPCLLALRGQLGRHQDNDEALNAFLISYLIDLGSVESLPVIKEAFDGGSVDLMVAGDYEDVEIELGVREHRSAPPPLTPFQQEITAMREQLESPQVIKGRKIGRNEPCPCGSGKKYKKCCLNS